MFLLDLFNITIIKTFPNGFENEFLIILFRELSMSSSGEIFMPVSALNAASTGCKNFGWRTKIIFWEKFWNTSVSPRQEVWWSEREKEREERECSIINTPLKPQSAILFFHGLSQEKVIESAILTQSEWTCYFHHWLSLPHQLSPAHTHPVHIPKG